MATQAPANQKPLFYDRLEPLSSQTHHNFKIQPQDNAPYLAKTHAVPLTVDEFISAQRNYPIVFSAGEQPVPLALMGLNEGVNVFVDDQGKLLSPTYVPAYVRRYPFMLARLRQDSEELSLCFDPSSPAVGPFEQGNALFDGEKPTEALNEVLKFCEDFEIAAQRTNAFMNDIAQSGLLMDGEVSIQPTGYEQPFIYRGFQMIDENKIRDMDTATIERFHKNGALPLIMAHLFSLSQIRDIFGRQLATGRVPTQQAAQQPATAGA